MLACFLGKLQCWNIARIECLQNCKIRASLTVTVGCKQDGELHVLISSDEM